VALGDIKDSLIYAGDLGGRGDCEFRLRAGNESGEGRA